MEKKMKKEKQIDPKVRTFFLLAFPTMLIIALSMLFDVDIKVGAMMIMIAIYQFLMLKQFVNQYHEVL